MTLKIAVQRSAFATAHFPVQEIVPLSGKVVHDGVWAFISSAFALHILLTAISIITDRKIVSYNLGGGPILR